MADILKITTPTLNKNAVPASKQVSDPSLPFGVEDVPRIIKSTPQSDILGQNNNLDGSNSPAILMDMLKDPSVTVGLLKNIFLIEDLVSLLPINNNAITQEIQQIFDSMLISPENIVSELISQEGSSSTFKGPLFDFLRSLLEGNASPQLGANITKFLKSLHLLTSQRDVLDSIGNNLEFLSKSFSPSKEFSLELLNLSQAFKQPDAPKFFSNLKNHVLEVIKTAEQSILLTPKVEKALPLIVYNLSRYNDNPDFLRSTVADLTIFLNSQEDKRTFAKLVNHFLSSYYKGEVSSSSSRIMDTIAKIISISQQESDSILTADKTEKIIQSLLSSPCNFTPLLHFIIPVEFVGMKSFAEIWIDPNDESGKNKKGEPDSQTHILVVFDIEGIGSFESEMFVKGNKIFLSLMCPETYLKDFEHISKTLPSITTGLDYEFAEIRISKLEGTRSLMEVFKDLPYRRTGIDVTI